MAQEESLLIFCTAIFIKLVLSEKRVGGANMEGGVTNLTYKQPCTLTFNVVKCLDCL